MSDTTNPPAPPKPAAKEVKKCEYCDKVGLPILPLRYGVASEGVGAPETNIPKIKLGEGAAHYTHRLVRSGYLYVYDLARDVWESYFVTKESYFFRIDINPKVQPIIPAKPFDCADEAHRAIASCITIPNAKKATKVWIGFSDVRWTDDVLKLHNNPAYREKHMRVIDVQAGIAGKDAQHMFAIKEVNDKVADYAMPKRKLADGFAWSPFGTAGRQGQGEKLIEECEKLKPGKGLAVTISDPTAIAQELAMLMHRNHSLFINKPTLKRQLTIHGVIEQMQMAIKDQAQKDEIKAADSLANDQASQPDIGVLFSKSYADQRQKRIDKMRTCTAEELNRASMHEWAKYKSKYKFQKADNWKAEFDKQYKHYDGKFIAPLAKAHADWMQRESMAHYFECNFDPKNLQSGAVYANVLSQCISTTSDKKACFDVYEKWLQGDANDRKNLLLCAFQFNNDEIKAAVQSAASNSVSYATLPWDKLIEAHGRASDKLLAGHADTVGRLIGAAAGPIAGLLKKAAENKKVYSGLLAIGAATKHPVIEVHVTGAKKSFRAAVIREILEQGGLDVKAVGIRKMEKAVADELERLAIHGVPLNGQQTKTFLLMIDPAEVHAMPAGLKPQAQAQWLAKTIRTPEQVEALNLGKFRLRLANWGAAGKGAIPIGFGLLGALANAVAYCSMVDEDAKTLDFAKNESHMRIGSQSAQLVGAIASTMELALVKIPAFSSAWAMSLKSLSVALSKVTGKVLGVGGSLFMGLIDLWRANEERLEGNWGAAGAYLVSGVLGIAATLFLLIGWTGWGLIVVAIAVVWAFVMTLLVDNKLQDWLERCVFGIFDESKQYPSLEKEMAEFKIATAA